MTRDSQDGPRRSAMRFIVLLGFVSLFADMTYEGARSAAGPFLAMLGASATAVGVLAGRWEIAAVLMMTERLGKALRNPARDAMLSHATHQVGRGWGFGIHEAMDQIGAMTGPVIVTIVLAWKGSYTHAFAALAVPASIALMVLAAGFVDFPLAA